MLLINIVIPVCSLHISYIENCIESIKNQTRLPNNVVLVLNEYSRYKTEYDKILNEHTDYIFVKIDTWETPGTNRNIGSSHCINGIIIYQDVDDIMHPQRCELVEMYFEKYKCDLLLHGCIQDYSSSKNKKNVLKFSKKYIISQKNVNAELEKFEFFHDNSPIINFSNNFSVLNDKKINLTHGECCVKVSLLKDNDNSWKNYYKSEDLYFVNNITKKYKNTLIVLHNLVTIVGKEHIRLIGNDVKKYKSQKKIKYEPILGQ